MPSTNTLLPSLSHAASGAAGTLLSTLTTYPLDLVNTRLKVQRQLRADGELEDGGGYAGALDAFRTIYAREGGAGAFFVGLGAELGKAGADSFLFFLFYNWFRSSRLVGHKDAPYLRVLEELAVGAAAGACAKAFTTPVSNVVTRRQTARLLQSNDTTDEKAGHKSVPDPSFGEMMAEIRRERGLLGLWAGYSASLVLTLNPSITFFLQAVLKRAAVPREKWDDPGAQVTFLLAAVSKVVATAVTYPFQIAKARVQVSAPGEKKGGVNLAKDTIFATVLRIARAEGPAALYDGIAGELLKGFFSHGTTMLSKDVIHRLVIQLYFTILAALRRYPQFRVGLAARLRKARTEAQERLVRASTSGASEARKGARHVKDTVGADGKATAHLLKPSQRIISK